MARTLLLLLAATSTIAAQTPRWTLSLQPTLDLGDDSSVHTQFDSVSGILRMPGGEIVIANGLSQELRVFSSTGTYVRTLTGSRANAMRSLTGIWRGGDTIYAAEVTPTESAVWIFTLDGFVARKPMGAANAGGIYPIDRFADGRFVISAAPRRQSVMNAAGTFLDSVPIGTLSLSDVAGPKWIGWLRNEYVMLPGFGRGGRGGGQPRPRLQYPYGRSTSFAVSGDRLWIGDSETGSITQHSSAGRGLTILPAPTPARALDTAAIARRRAAALSSLSGVDGSRTELYYPTPVARTAPRFARLVPGTNGEMWVESFDEDPAAGHVFLVLDRSGRAVGRVTLPAGLNLMYVGPDEVMGVRRDSDGLQHVVRFTLRR